MNARTLCIAFGLLLSSNVLHALSFDDFKPKDVKDAFKIGKDVVDMGKQLKEAKQDFTPEQEYYIGRSVTASILQTYPPLKDDTAVRYLNQITQSMAEASDQPLTFKGYRAIILDTDEINAFAAPGGYILISRGLLKLCENEDEVAAIIAHEMGHLEHRHGIQAIKGARMKQFGKLLVGKAGELAGGDLKEAVTVFQNGVDDIVHEMLRTGYSRDWELAADASAAGTLKRTGYAPSALISVLKKLHQHASTEKEGWFNTHPEPTVRIKAVKKLARGDGLPATYTRDQRFRLGMDPILHPSRKLIDPLLPGDEE